MRKINIKLAIVFSFMTIGFIHNVAAQVYSKGKCLYEYVGSYQAVYTVVSFDGSTAYLYSYERTKACVGYLHLSERGLKSGYKRSSSYLEDLPVVMTLRYDSDLSTSMRFVYRFECNLYDEPIAYYVAVNKDLSTIKCWMERGGRVYGCLHRSSSDSDHSGKHMECVRVDPEIFKPKAVNYDFLND